MRFLICLSLVLSAATGVFAQRGGSVRMGGPVGVAPNAGMPALSPIPPLQPIPALGLSAPAVHPSARPFGVFPAYSYFPTGGYAASPPVQNFVVLQVAPQPSPNPEPPPKPPTSMIWESGNAAPVAQEQRAFAIALKDGTTVSAAAVWAQDNVLHYVDTEGAHKRVALAAIDRDITRRMNQAQNLVLQLPPPQ